MLLSSQSGPEANGASAHQVMAMFGWMTEQQAIHYRDGSKTEEARGVPKKHSNCSAQNARTGAVGRFGGAP